MTADIRVLNRYLQLRLSRASIGCKKYISAKPDNTVKTKVFMYLMYKVKICTFFS